MGIGPNSRNAIASPTAEKRVLAGNYSLYTTNQLFNKDFEKTGKK